MTPEQILHKWDAHVSEPCDKYPFTDADKIAFARAVIAQARAELIAEMVPVAYLAHGGRTFVDVPHRTLAGAQRSAEQRKDGASVSALAIIPSIKEIS